MPLRALVGSTAVLLSLAALPRHLSPEGRAALATLSEARALAGSIGDRVWPGYDLRQQRLVAYDGTRLALLVGPPPAPQGFKPVRGAGPSIYGHFGPIKAIQQAKSPAINLGGKPAVALPFDFLQSDEAPLPLQVFAPAFRAWENDHFLAAAEFERLAGRHYPSSDETNAEAAELENRLLADALRTSDATDAQTLAREFLAIRTERRRHLPAWVARFEDLSEVMTGMPRYVAEGYSDAAAMNSRWAARYVHSGFERWQESDRGLESALEFPVTPEALQGDRYPLTGLAEARLLDRLGGSWWRSEVQRGQTLDELLAVTTGFRLTDLPALVEAGRREGGWDDLLAAISDPGRRLPPAYRSWLRKPGRKVSCWLSPLGGKLKLSYTRPPLEIDARTLFAATLTQFTYERPRLDLQVSHTPVLCHGPSVEWPYEHVTFYLPPNASVRLDGKAFEPRDGSFLIGRSFTITAPGIHIEARAGRLVVRGRELDIRP